MLFARNTCHWRDCLLVPISHYFEVLDAGFSCKEQTLVYGRRSSFGFRGLDSTPTLGLKNIVKSHVCRTQDTDKGHKIKSAEVEREINNKEFKGYNTNNRR